MNDNKIIEENKSGFKRKYFRHKTFNEHMNISFGDDTFEKNINMNNMNKYNFVTKKSVFQKNNNVLKRQFTKKKVQIFRNKTVCSNIAETKSTTSNKSSEYKDIKKVTFSTVEIIRIKKFKSFNSKNNYSKAFIKQNMKEIKASQNKDLLCTIF